MWPPLQITGASMSAHSHRGPGGLASAGRVDRLIIPTTAAMPITMPTAIRLVFDIDPPVRWKLDRIRRFYARQRFRRDQLQDPGSRAYSVLAWTSTGTSGSASFHRARKSWYA